MMVVDDAALVEAVSAVVLPSVNRAYGLARVCTAWRVSHRRRRPEADEPRRRAGPMGPMTDAELVEAIRALLAESTFHGEGSGQPHRRLMNDPS